MTSDYFLTNTCFEPTTVVFPQQKAYPNFICIINDSEIGELGCRHTQSLTLCACHEKEPQTSGGGDFLPPPLRPGQTEYTLQTGLPKPLFGRTIPSPSLQRQKNLPVHREVRGEEPVITAPSIGKYKCDKRLFFNQYVF